MKQGLGPIRLLEDGQRCFRVASNLYYVQVSNKYVLFKYSTLLRNA